MIRRFLQASLLLLSPLAAAAAPAGFSFEEFAAPYIEKLGHEERIQLAIHFPKLFPLLFVCRFQPSQGAPVPVTPGTAVSADNGGTLKCPGLFEATMEKGSRFRALQHGEVPVVLLESGEMLVRPLASSLEIATDHMRLRLIANLGKDPQFGAKAQPGKELISCIGGRVDATLQMQANPAVKKYLDSVACLVTLQDQNRPRILFGSDTVEAENIRVYRRQWPAIQDEFALHFQRNQATKKVIYFSQNPGPPAAFSLSWWILVPEFWDPACVVYHRRSESEPLREAVKFAVTDRRQSGIVAMPPVTQGQEIVAVCETTTATFASRMLYSHQTQSPPAAGAGRALPAGSK